MRIQARTRRGRRAFTFLEIMFVVVIIGILMGVAVSRYVGKTTDSRIKSTQMQMEQVHSSLAMFEMHVGRFPDTREGLQALLVKPSNVPDQVWEGPYLTLRGEAEQVKDVWGNPLAYRAPGEKNRDYDLWSWGPDGRDGTEDDITG